MLPSLTRRDLLSDDPAKPLIKVIVGRLTNQADIRNEGVLPSEVLEQYVGYALLVQAKLRRSKVPICRPITNELLTTHCLALESVPIDKTSCLSHMVFNLVSLAVPSHQPVDLTPGLLAIADLALCTLLRAHAQRDATVHHRLGHFA